VVTTRAGDMFRQKLAALIAEGAKPDLVVLSPGPGTPTDFDLKGTMAALQEHEIPAFGVCLGLQGMVETFGGTLGVLDYPMHGKPSEVTVTAPPGESAKWGIFDGLPPRFTVARYHSLYGERDKLPACLRPTAETDDGVVMAIEHRTLPYAAVQFHPESILTADTNGLRMLSNALKHLKWPGAAGAGAAAVAAAAAAAAAPPSPARPATITVPGAAAPAAPAVPAASPGAGAAEALARLTVPKLKELCGSQGLRKSGKKADLVARLVAQGAAAY
jgi:anthranilate synthase/aminodeoxychorismate synthase-like glutamine amidotransferase